MLHGRGQGQRSADASKWQTFALRQAALNHSAPGEWLEHSTATFAPEEHTTCSAGDVCWRDMAQCLNGCSQSLWLS